MDYFKMSHSGSLQLLILYVLFFLIIYCGAKSTDRKSVDLIEDRNPLTEFRRDEGYERSPLEVVYFEPSSGESRSRRRKRDLEEIIRDRPIMYTPMIVKKITEGLNLAKNQLNILENYLVNPESVTSPPPTTSKPNLNVTTTTTTTTLPQTTTAAGNTTNTTTVAPGTNTTREQRTAEQVPINEPAILINTEGVPYRPFVPEEGYFRYAAIQNRQVFPPKQTQSATVENAASNATNQTATTTIPPVTTITSATTVGPTNTTMKPAPTSAKIIQVLWNLLNTSEMIMIDLFSKDRVIILEACITELSYINSNFYRTDLKDANLTLMYWVSLAQLSTKHSIQRLAEQKQTFKYIDKLDDITAVVTTGFCILALMLICYLCYLAGKQRKPYVVNHHSYNASSAYNVRNNNNNSHPAVGISPVIPVASMYSSPSRSAVATRTNPLYSSQTDVSGSENHPAQHDPMPHGVDTIADDPQIDNIDGRYDPVTEKNDKNMSRERRGQPNTLSPTDYRDPRRDRRSHLDQYRDNLAFVGDDGTVAARPNSESAL